MSDISEWPGSESAVEQIFRFFGLKYKKISESAVGFTVFGAKIDKHDLMCLSINPEDPTFIQLDFRDKRRKNEHSGAWSYYGCSTLQLKEEKDARGNDVRRAVMTIKNGQAAISQTRAGKERYYGTV